MFSLDAFATRLKGIRIELCLSQEALAHKLGISRVALSYYENGQRTPDIAFLQSLHEATGYPLEYLMGMSEARETENVNLSAATGLSDEALTFVAKNADSLNKLTCAAYADLEAWLAALDLFIEGEWARVEGTEFSTYLLLDEAFKTTSADLASRCKLIGYRSLSDSSRAKLRSMIHKQLNAEERTADLKAKLFSMYSDRDMDSSGWDSFDALRKRELDDMAAKKLRDLDELYKDSLFD